MVLRPMQGMTPTEKVRFMTEVNRIVRSGADTTDQRQELYKLNITPYEADILQRETWNGQRGYTTAMVDQQKTFAIAKRKRKQYAQRGAGQRR